MTITYGVISDLHGIDIRAVPLAIQVLKDHEVDALVLNGDLMGECSQYPQDQYLATVLDLAGQSGLETYVLPGSHEEIQVFDPILADFAHKYANIINTLEHQRIDTGNHHLVFLPGSHIHSEESADNGYVLNEQCPSGFYVHDGGRVRVINVNDLQRLISDPDQTLVFSHVPRRFDNVESCVDMAEYGIMQREFEAFNQVFQPGRIVPGPLGEALAEQGAAVELRRENRGNETLRKVYQELGITKAVSGHFHESAGRAHDHNAQVVEDGLFVPTLFYNASCLERMMVGLVSMDANKVAYENLDLLKFCR